MPYCPPPIRRPSPLPPQVPFEALEAFLAASAQSLTPFLS